MTEAWREVLRDPNPWTVPNPLPAPLRIDGLCIRVYRSGDGVSLFETLSKERDSLLPWMVWVKTDHQTLDDSVYYVERQRRAMAKPECRDFHLGIWEEERGRLVAATGLHRIDADTRQAEVGYWVAGSFQRRGVCTRAVGALISSALTPAGRGGWGLRRITVETAAENTASAGVCNKLGLRLEKRERLRDYFVDRYLDTLGYAVLDQEWDFQAHRARPGIDWPGRWR
jgi:RimJ/RimL family protein N-acetyltransferase